MLKKKGFTIGEKINFGSFSKVYRAKYNKKDIAVKVIDLEKTSADYRNKFLPRELYTLRKLRHPNIVSIYEIFTIGPKIYIFMDLADGGDILDYLKANGPIPEEKCKIWFKQAADALAYVHSYGIVHRDLKIENILLDKKGSAKLTDFGFSRTIFDPRTGKRLLSETYCGSAAYCAPEVIRGSPYNPMLADVWSMGVLLFVMANNAFPFEDSDLAKMLYRQMNKKWEHTKKVEKLLSPEMKDIIQKMLEPDISKRLTMTKVLAHPWLRGVQNTALKN
ncbi:Testis-specific serine/threonine-protein kinase 1-like protein [Dinothrombium tinctorium]|uniref:Testis-specific serine/threonine-protein kinase 1-like protein n=1 Tax=Dinothrombium tinctorium TaxID=1965070 RepID=A0A3S4Q5M4_9ACAR|nr:Testis-specific serine/threonine-protein kinase 1-like protein [Dinothrombium tinctorium]RWR99085.1 Testis-specific serine/threonine-protein kinase 1-like protein [Dinothrombium tinctorium]